MSADVVNYLYFFFSSRRRHTRCSRDWSSDVCSSDLVAPADDGISHAADELPNRGFAVGSAHLAVKILARDDVGGRLRPGFWNLHIFLTEDGRALFVADQGDAFFPFDRVERRFFAVGKVARKSQTFPRACGRSLYRIRRPRISA